MIKQLFFTAALLMPGLAYGGNPSADLSGQIVPAGQDPTPPPQAAAAGFTTPVIISDFTSAAYSDTSTWLQCAGGPTVSNPIWYHGAISFNPPYAPCPTITSDAAVPQVLQILWRTTDAHGSGSTLNSNNGITTYRNAGILFPNYYFEALVRSTPVQANNFLNMPWTLAGPQIEFDAMEIYSNSFTDACAHNWQLNGAGTCLWYGTAPPNYSNFDMTQYHIYGQRVTSDGSTAIYQCSYIDNISQGCQAITNATAAQITNGQVQNGYIGNGTCCTVGQNVASNLFTYVQWAHIWSCSGWQSSKCFTSSPNP